MGYGSIWNMGPYWIWVHMGYGSIWGMGPYGTGVHMGQGSIWDSGPYGTGVHMGQGSIWDRSPYGAWVHRSGGGPGVKVDRCGVERQFLGSVHRTAPRAGWEVQHLETSFFLSSPVTACLWFDSAGQAKRPSILLCFRRGGVASPTPDPATQDFRSRLPRRHYEKLVAGRVALD